MFFLFIAPPVFLLPEACITAHERLVRNFSWGDYDEKRKMETITWKRICSTKANGGLGIRSIQDIADPALLRQSWFIASKRSSIWVQWAYNKDIRERSFRDVKTPSNCSGDGEA